jgi:hypothetical protein
MKAKLEFDLPEDDYLFDAACKGAEWKASIQELDKELRAVYKYGEDEKEVDFAVKWREKLWSILNDNGLTLE